MQGASSAGGGGAAETDAQEVALLLARFACNAHTICDDELQPVGAAPEDMFTSPSMLACNRFVLAS